MAKLENIPLLIAKEESFPQAYKIGWFLQHDTNNWQWIIWSAFSSRIEAIEHARKTAIKYNSNCIYISDRVLNSKQITKGNFTKKKIDI